MLRISYFAWVRERMGIAEEAVALPDNVVTLADLVAWLAARDAAGAQAFSEPARIRAAIDGNMATLDAALPHSGEIALFPPVTGG